MKCIFKIQKYQNNFKKCQLLVVVNSHCNNLLSLGFIQLALRPIEKKKPRFLTKQGVIEIFFIILFREKNQLQCLTTKYITCMDHSMYYSLDQPQLLPGDLFQVLKAAGTTSKLIIGIVFRHQNATSAIDAVASPIQSAQAIQLAVRPIDGFSPHFLRISSLILGV